MEIGVINKKIITILFLVVVMAPSSRGATSHFPGAPPERMLWSWFADDDLRFLSARTAGVAFRALSVTFRGNAEVIPHPRRTRLRTAPGTYEMAVVRFDFGGRPGFSERQRHLALRMIEETITLTGARALQIDFDAPRSAYDFYRQLLGDLRRDLGRSVFLSITALVDWCGERSWMSGLPVDEMVAMEFAMGPAANRVTAQLRSGEEFAFAGCRTSIGLDRAGPFYKARMGQRVYFFSTGSWSAMGVRAALKAVKG